MNRTKNSIYNLLSGLGGQLLVVLVRFYTRTVFIETLGAQYLGINGLFSDILTMLSLTELGLDTALNFKLYKPLAENDDRRVRIIMKFYKTAYTIIGVVILALGIGIIPLLPYLIQDYDTLQNLGINAVLIFILYLLQSVSSYLFLAYRSAIIKAAQKSYILNIAGYVVTILTNISQVIILRVWRSFTLYTACVIFYNIVQNIINSKIATKYYPKAFIKEKEKLSISEIRDIFKDLSALFLYKVNGVVLKATDNLVLSTFMGLSIVGLYSNYLLFYTTIRGILNKIYDAVKASAGNLFAIGDSNQKYLFFKVMNLVSALMFGTACVGVSVEANELICQWIGSNYVIPQPFSILMGIEIFFVGIKLNLGTIRNVSGAFRQMWFRPLLGIVVNLAVSIAMVNKCGIYGVLIGTIVADFSTNFMVDPFVIFKYSLDENRSVSEYYKKNAQYVVVILAVGLIDRTICTSFFVGLGWFSVAIHCIICGLSVPSAFYIAFKNDEECRYLIKKIKSIVKSKNKL